MNSQHSGQRLRNLLEERGVKFNEFAESLGLPPQNLNNWFQRGVPKSQARQVAARLAISRDWLEDGIGDKEGGPESRETNGAYHPGITPVTTWDDDTPLDDDEVEVPFLKEVELSAGGGRTVIQESSSFKLRFGKYTLRRHNVQVDHAVCVPIYGNSMEPVLRSGATVGVDRSKTSVIDGDLYAINHAGQLRVKQLYRLPGGGIRMRSFNRDEHPDEEYTPEQMEAREICLIGRVFWGAMFF